MVILERGVSNAVVDSVVEEVFQVEKYNPLHGWFGWNATDRVGNPVFSPTNDDTTFCPHVELISEWLWSHPWIVDINYCQCDEEGWCYASTMSRLNIHLAEGTSKPKKEAHHFVRRRRWIRTRVRSAQVRLESDAEEKPRPKRHYKIHRDSTLSHYLRGRSSTSGNFMHLEFEQDDIAREGWLGKRGSFSRNWKLRYFMLRRDINSLIYLNDTKHFIQLGEIHINGHTSVISEKPAADGSLKYIFVILNGDQQYKLNAQDEITRSEWMSSISEMIVQCRASFLEAGDRRGSESDSEQSKPNWKPYSLLSATMHRRVNDVEQVYVDLHHETVNQSPFN